MDAAVTIAMSLHQIGLRPFPVDPKTKLPKILWGELQERSPTEGEVRRWWEQWPDAAVAIVAGHVGALCALDIDKLPDPKTGARKALPNPWPGNPDKPLPVGWVIETPSGGRLHFFRTPEGDPIRNSAGVIAPGVDVRGAGGMAVVFGPGRSTVCGSPAEALETDCPDWLLAANRTVGKSVGPSRPAVDPKSVLDGVPFGQRDDTLFRYACRLRTQGLKREEAIILVRQAAGHCKPPFPVVDADAKVGQAWKYPAGSVPAAQDVPQDKDTHARKDYGHAQMLSRLFKDRYRWAEHRRSWLQYIGGAWRPVSDAVTAKNATEILRKHYAMLLDGAIGNKMATQDLITRAAETCVFARINGALSFLQGWPGFVTKTEDWDRDPWLLNVANGTLDLKTLTLSPHDPTALHTRQCPVDYNPEATGPIWDHHLELFLPDSDVRRYVRRQFGKALVGTILDEDLDVWYGTGANGKSTTTHAIYGALGSYAARAAPDLLVRTKYESHPTQIADLHGKRLVFSVEVDEGKRLAEGLAKQLSGGDHIKARYMRADFFEWKPTHSLVMVVNHKPVITGVDPAIWRRIHLIPWTVTVPEDVRRPQHEIVADLQAEGSAILNWMLAGLADWQADHWWVAGAVKVATEQYRTEQDRLAGFLAERCELGTWYTVPIRDLYDAYINWATEAGEDPIAKIKFGDLLRQRGIGQTRKSHTGTRLWLGVRSRVTSGDKVSDIPLREREIGITWKGGHPLSPTEEILPFQDRESSDGADNGEPQTPF